MGLCNERTFGELICKGWATDEINSLPNLPKRPFPANAKALIFQYRVENKSEGSNKSQEQMPRHCSCLTFFNILWLVCVLLSHPSLHLRSSPGHPVRLYAQPHHKLFCPVACCGGKPLDMKKPHVFLLAFLDLCSPLEKDFWWRRLLLLSSAAPAAPAFHQTTVESSATLASRYSSKAEAPVKPSLARNRFLSSFHWKLDAIHPPWSHAAVERTDNVFVSEQKFSCMLRDREPCLAMHFR